MQSPLLITLGDLVWDVVVQPDVKLLAGGDTTGQIALRPGGSAANTAVWIGRTGGNAGFVGAVGTDFFGDAIVQDLKHERVQSWIVRTAERDTGVVLVMVDQDGQRSMVTNQGADFTLRPEDLPVAALQTAQHVHLTAWSLFTEPPRAAALEAARIAHRSGATVSLDPASFQMIRDFGRERFIELFAEVTIDFIFPNRDEAHVLTGEHEPASMSQVLRRLFPQAVIVLKLDEDGCYVLSENNAEHYPTKLARVVDTTGAGDSFNAAFLSLYFATGSLTQAAHMANAVAGWVVTQTGARPTPDDALQSILSGIIEPIREQ